MDLGTLVRQHERSLWATCYRLVGDADEARDLAQETFVRAITSPPADLDAPLGPWLHRVAHNLALDWLRHRRHVDAHAVAFVAEPHLPDTDRVADLVDSAHGVLLRQLASMSASERMVWICRELLDYSVEETATALDTSPGTVKTLLGRARKRTAPAPAAPERVGEALAQVVAWSLSLRWDAPDAGPAGTRAGAAGSLLALVNLVVDAARRQAHDVLPAALLARAQLLQRDRDGRVDDLREAIALAAARADDALRGRAMQALALWLPHADPEAVPLLRGAEALAAASGDLPTQVSALNDLIWRLSEIGQRAEARALLDALERLVAERIPGQPGRIGVGLLSGRGMILMQDSAYEGALEAFRALAELARSLSDAALWGGATSNQGIALRGLGRLDEARSAFLTAADILQRAGLTEDLLGPMLNLGLVEQGLGRLDDAVVALSRAEREARAQRDDKGLALALFNLGVVEHQRGRRPRARALLEEALAVIRSGGFLMLEAGALAHLGAVCAAIGDPAAGAEALARARALAEGQGWPAFVALCDLLDGFVQPETARARLERADLEGFVELRAAAQLLQRRLEASPD
ncbi:MAG: sigma-70 family RNA polymerase sigma factor [Myxococcota bacterium]